MIEEKQDPPFCEIRIIPNAWGWHGRMDRPGYEVRFYGEVWVQVCSYEQAAKIALERGAQPVIG